MSEKYVKDILKKLDEIEKLHEKLRSLVPRLKNNEPESILNAQRSNGILKRNANGPNDETSRNSFGESQTSIKNFYASPTRDSSVLSRERFNRLRSGSVGAGWRKFRRNSVDFLTKQWHEKNKKIKNLLASLNEDDIILVTRAVQTLDAEQPERTRRKRSVTGHPDTKSSHRTNQSADRRRSTAQEMLERFLEHFSYSRESGPVNEKRVDVQNHPLGNSNPRIVQKPLLFPDEETETSNILSSARRVSCDVNKHKCE